MIAKTLAAPPAAEPPLRVYVAGGIAVRGPDGAVVGERAFPGRLGRRLFVRLAAIHEPVGEEELADALWGDDRPAAWSVSLRALVSKIRSVLARAGVRNAIVCRDGTYVLRLPVGTWLDIDEARGAIHRAERARSIGDLADACGWALAARAIASRSLLPGEDAPWIDRVRMSLADVRLRALECLGEIWIDHADPALAARDAAEAIGLDPFRETAHQLLIRAHLAAGDHAAAVRAYVECRQVLGDELGTTPAPETEELIRPILEERRSW